MMVMKIDLKKTRFSFQDKPLLIGGMAMEYYGIRKSDRDIDLVISKRDFGKIIQKYPHSLKDLCGDLGIVVDKFEIWKTINYFDYEYLKEKSIEENNYLVISLEKLLFLKALASHKEKYHNDMKMIVNKINSLQGKNIR